MAKHPTWLPKGWVAVNEANAWRCRKVRPDGTLLDVFVQMGKEWAHLTTHTMRADRGEEQHGDARDLTEHSASPRLADQIHAYLVELEDHAAARFRGDNREDRGTIAPSWCPAGYRLCGTPVPSEPGTPYTGLEGPGVQISYGEMVRARVVLSPDFPGATPPVYTAFVRIEFVAGYGGTSGQPPYRCFTAIDLTEQGLRLLLTQLRDSVLDPRPQRSA